jgi:hypothetical protein
MSNLIRITSKTLKKTKTPKTKKKKMPKSSASSSNDDDSQSASSSESSETSKKKKKKKKKPKPNQKQDEKKKTSKKRKTTSVTKKKDDTTQHTSSSSSSAKKQKTDNDDTKEKLEIPDRPWLVKTIAVTATTSLKILLANSAFKHEILTMKYTGGKTVMDQLTAECRGHTFTIVRDSVRLLHADLSKDTTVLTQVELDTWATVHSNVLVELQALEAEHGRRHSRICVNDAQAKKLIAQSSASTHAILWLNKLRGFKMPDDNQKKPTEFGKFLDKSWQGDWFDLSTVLVDHDQIPILNWLLLRLHHQCYHNCWVQTSKMWKMLQTKAFDGLWLSGDVVHKLIDHFEKTPGFQFGSTLEFILRNIVEMGLWNPNNRFPLTCFGDQPVTILQWVEIRGPKVFNSEFAGILLSFTQDAIHKRWPAYLLSVSSRISAVVYFPDIPQQIVLDFL